ncbi:hypothetical protein RRG08_027329 [Elysia crispata]|uniref:Uncharacterized protein n=1 Tax=Elysia crispata TaxID=231223 RepID=A0AAE1DJB4_9GAST|nr:hypothetical protein RRG08_027329 [Elysia crispata]
MAGNQLFSTQEEKMIPPWKLLKHAITEACSSDECDIPLASLRRAVSVAKVYRIYEETYKDCERASLDKHRRISDVEFNLASHRPKKRPM